MDEVQILTKPKNDIKLALPIGKSIMFIPRREVISIDSLGNYCQVHTLNNGTLIVYTSMKKLESALSDHSFYRINRSCLVNILHLASYEPDQRKVVLENGYELPVSRRNSCQFKDYLSKMVFN